MHVYGLIVDSMTGLYARPENNGADCLADTRSAEIHTFRLRDDEVTSNRTKLYKDVTFVWGDLHEVGNVRGARGWGYKMILELLQCCSHVSGLIMVSHYGPTYARDKRMIMSNAASEKAGHYAHVGHRMSEQSYTLSHIDNTKTDRLLFVCGSCLYIFKAHYTPCLCGWSQRHSAFCNCFLEVPKFGSNFNSIGPL